MAFWFIWYPRYQPSWSNNFFSYPAIASVAPARVGVPPEQTYVPVSSYMYNTQPSVTTVAPTVTTTYYY